MSLSLLKDKSGHEKATTDEYIVCMEKRKKKEVN